MSKEREAAKNDDNKSIWERLEAQNGYAKVRLRCGIVRQAFIGGFGIVVEFKNEDMQPNGQHGDEKGPLDIVDVLTEEGE